jgi:natural product precursor
MKKLNKIQLKNVLVLEVQEMKRIHGGSGGSGSSGSGATWCRIDGEDILVNCTSDAQCVELYGSGARCIS